MIGRLRHGRGGARMAARPRTSRELIATVCRVVLWLAFGVVLSRGLVGKRATSVEKLGAGRIATAAAARAYAECFATAFALDITWGKASELAGLKGPDPVPTLSVVGR